MIIAPDPLLPFDVPALADFSLRFRTPLTAQQVTDATRRAVRFFSPSGGEVEHAAAASGADILLAVTPGMFSAGRWTFRPEVVSAGKTYAWAEAGTMDVLKPGYSRAAAGC